MCSTTIEFPSKYAVLTYGKPGINVSTKIKNDPLRKELSTICNDAIKELSHDNSLYGMPEPPMQQEEVMPERHETVSIEKDPFEAFGDSIEISDNDLPF